VPRYDYRCTACGHFYEKLESFEAPASQPCPVCSQTARRVISPPPIIFKGAGFYITDSKREASMSFGVNPDKGDENPANSATIPAPKEWTPPAANGSPAPTAPAAEPAPAAPAAPAASTASDSTTSTTTP
jgi:putative FmdB family regulatory protein